MHAKPSTESAPGKYRKSASRPFQVPVRHAQLALLSCQASWCRGVHRKALQLGAKRVTPQWAACCGKPAAAPASRPGALQPARCLPCHLPAPLPWPCRLWSAQPLHSTGTVGVRTETLYRRQTRMAWPSEGPTLGLSRAKAEACYHWQSSTAGRTGAGMYILLCSLPHCWGVLHIKAVMPMVHAAAAADHEAQQHGPAQDACLHGLASVASSSGAAGTGLAGPAASSRCQQPSTRAVVVA